MARYLALENLEGSQTTFFFFFVKSKKRGNEGHHWEERMTKMEGDIHSKKTGARWFGGEVGTDFMGGSPEFPSQFLECDLALLSRDNLLG